SRLPLAHRSPFVARPLPPVARDRLDASRLTVEPSFAFGFRSRGPSISRAPSSWRQSLSAPPPSVKSIHRRPRLATHCSKIRGSSTPLRSNVPPRSPSEDEETLFAPAMPIHHEETDARQRPNGTAAGSTTNVRSDSR